MSSPPSRTFVVPPDAVGGTGNKQRTVNIAADTRTYQVPNNE